MNRDPDPGHFSDVAWGVAILGCGTIAESAHLPATSSTASGVTGVWSRSQTTTATVASGSRSSAVSTRARGEPLADPEVRYVDLATGPKAD